MNMATYFHYASSLGIELITFVLLTHNVTNLANCHIVTKTMVKWFEKLKNISPPFLADILFLGDEDDPIFVDSDTAHNGCSFT